eukprot:m51a1_g4835 hypothetical protein (486) ;mRNA; f:209345-211278
MQQRTPSPSPGSTLECVAAQATLETAWQLRQHVVPCLCDAGDLCALAEAQCPTLCAPCLSRLPLAALLLRTASLPTAVLLGELVRRCPGLLNGACDPLLRLRLLAQVPGAGDDSGRALMEACRAGGPRAADLVRELAVAPFCAQATGKGALSEALRAACAHGDVETVRVLSAAPYALGHAHAVCFPEGSKTATNALDCACRKGRLGAVDLLAGPPFNLSRQDLCLSGFRPLEFACSAGSADVVRRLSRPPFSLGQADARQCSALRCASHSVAVLDVLALKPYSLGHADALAQGALKRACGCSSAEPLRRLARQPYGMGSADVVDSGSLRTACRCGSVAVLDALAEPPFVQAPRDADEYRSLLLDAVGPAREHRHEMLATACEVGQVGVVEQLARPPYSLGQADAREANALLVACEKGRAAVVRALARELCLGHEDASRDGNLCLLYACMCGSIDTVRALSEPPYSLAVDADCPESLEAALSIHFA